MLELIVNIVNKQSADESDEELVRMVGWGGATLEVLYDMNYNWNAQPKPRIIE